MQRAAHHANIHVGVQNAIMRFDEVCNHYTLFSFYTAPTIPYLPLPHHYRVTNCLEPFWLSCRRHSSVSFTGRTTRATRSTRSRSSDSASHCSLAATGKILCDSWRSCAPRATDPVAQAPNAETSVKVSDLHPYQFFTTLLQPIPGCSKRQQGRWLCSWGRNCKPSGLP